MIKFFAIKLRATTALPAFFAFAALLNLVLPVCTTYAQQQGVPTRVMVRAIANDAKVIHDGVGGARITIRDISNGQILSQGIQTGSSGDTEKIMRQPHIRGAVKFDTPGTAGYLATIWLDRPTMVEITAEGPLDPVHATQRTSKTMLLVPGVDVVGEGVIMTINGFVVDLLSPDEEVTVRAGQTLPVRAHITMMCGCVTEPGGLWDPNEYQIRARLVRGNEVVAQVPMEYAGTPNLYEAALVIPDSGVRELTLEVLAMDPEDANFGIDRQQVNVRQ